MPRGVSQEVLAEQRNHPGAMRAGQLRMMLGLSDATFKRYRKAGRIPDPEITLSNGWPLWSDQQVKDLLARRITLGRVHRYRV